MRVARALVAVLVIVTLTASAAGCGGSSDSSDTTETTTETTETTTETTETTDTASSEAEVTSFEVGGLDCKNQSAGSATVSVTWTAEATTAVELDVDGQLQNTAGPTGEANLTVPCDNEPHEISITARNDSGTGETESETITAG
jgi:hypothetical protein